MARAKEKNTRLFYNDEARIAMYEAMPAEQFKELILSMLKYKYGDDTVVDSISDPMVKALFMKEKVEIDRNEQRWNEIREIKREAGKKGGRPKKEESIPTRQETDSGPEQEQVEDKTETDFNKDFEIAREMFRTGDWRYPHKLNDIKNKYLVDYFELKEMVEV